jgi:hypothetical protein
MVYPYFRFKLHDLETLSNLQSLIKPGTRQYELLYYFAEKAGGSAYDIGRVPTDQDYKVARRRIKRLKDLKLLEEVTKCPNIHNAHYYKLSAHGVYHIIADKDSLKYGILNSLLKNYGDHPLFRCFLYPCIKQETLLELTDSAISSHTFSYLHDCCQSMQEMIYEISHTYNQQNGNLTQYLFSWDNISKKDKDKDKDRLRSFLKRKFKWNWVDNAVFSKTEYGNSIKVSHGLNSALITLNNDKTNATVSFKGKKLLKFDVKGSSVWTSELPTILLANISSSSVYGNFTSNLANTIIRNYVNRYNRQYVPYNIDITLVMIDN